MRRHHGSKFGKNVSRKLTKRSRKSTHRRPSFSLEALEMRNMMAVTTFQDGVSGYTGTEDAVIYSISPNNNFGTETGISVDQQDVAGVRQGLLQFADIFTSTNEAGKIPLGSTINSASITFSVFNDSNSSMQMSFYRLLKDWDELDASWNDPFLGPANPVGGVQASEGEAEGLPPDGLLLDAATGTKNVDVTTSLRHWAAGESNFGWLVESAATNGWDFNTSEAALNVRPKLTVDYTAPSGAGQFRFLNLTPVHTEGDTGNTIHELTVARVGGTAGTVSVDFDIAAGPGSNGATVGVDFDPDNPAADTLTFGPGETVKTIFVTIHGDTALEGAETISVSLNNPTGGATIDAAADDALLTIADDDALINEVL
ncbi:MAG: DNRLRE domain-containing protein, partial [Pirellulales bacterium]